MLYGDPTFAFDPAEKEEEIEEPVVEISPLQNGAVMRGHGAAVTMAAKPRRSSLGFLLFERSSCAAVSLATPISSRLVTNGPWRSALNPAIPDATGTTKDEALESSKEAGVPEPTGEQSKRRARIVRG
jgi:hypothetical protein